MPAQVPEAPEFLKGYARAEWDRIVEELYRLGLLTIAFSRSPPIAPPTTVGARRAGFTSIATANAARAESALIAMLSTKLRFTVQSRDDDVATARRRARSPTTGRRPWEPQDDGDSLDS